METRQRFRPKQRIGTGGPKGKVPKGATNLRTKKFGTRTPKRLIATPKRSVKVDMSALLGHLDPKKKGSGGTSL